MEMLLEARSLTKLYGVVLGVNDVTLDLPAGAYGLLGPNASGKSTLLKLVTGQLKPSEGTVRVLGHVPWNRQELFRRVGFCPEQDAFYSFLSAFEFVRTLAKLSGFDPGEARRRAERALERVGATSFMHRRISTYSKGMRQRTKVAQSLVHDPELLILDEPLRGTDPVGRRDLVALIRGLAEEGRSVIVSSHVLHEVEAMTDAFLLLHAGRIRAHGTVEEIRSLLEDSPHRVRVHTDRVRPLAARLVAGSGVEGVEIDEEAGVLAVRTRDPIALFEQLGSLVEEERFDVEELHSQDDDLESVFHYLMSRR